MDIRYVNDTTNESIIVEDARIELLDGYWCLSGYVDGGDFCREIVGNGGKIEQRGGELMAFAPIRC